MKRIVRANVLAIAGVAVCMALGSCGRRSESGAGAATAVAGISDDAVKIGASFPLSGPVSNPGNAQLGGLQAYIGAVNDAGGVKMADGKTRKIMLIYYDDAYDPARVQQNYRRLVDVDGVFAVVDTFGTAGNAALMPLATKEGVPQVFVASGASKFSADPAANPWTVGWQPTYESEARMVGKALAARNQPLKVAFLSQNDDLGKAYRKGFDDGIAGSQVTVVAAQTYEPRDPTLDSQISQLAASKADVLYSAAAIPKLQAGALAKLHELDWTPETYITILTSGLQDVIKPSGVATFLPKVYSAGFVKNADDPQWQNDPAVQTYLERMKKYSPRANAAVPNGVWGYGTGDTLVHALAGMKEPSRQALMDSIRSLKTSEVSILLPGLSIDGTVTGQPPVSGVRLRQLVDGSWKIIDT